MKRREELTTRTTSGIVPDLKMNWRESSPGGKDPKAFSPLCPCHPIAAAATADVNEENTVASDHIGTPFTVDAEFPRLDHECEEPGNALHDEQCP